jgi:outer membrane cobalamin receptor
MAPYNDYLMKYSALAAIFSLIFFVRSAAQTDTAAAILSIPISKYFKTEQQAQVVTKRVSIADLSELDVKEAPGTILVLERQEILATGARDIMEVLACIPGFNFGADVDGVIGLAIRGNWVHEGKFLLLYNGIPLNELDFGTFAFGQRVNLSNISRIEVINGPGAIRFGSTAALGIINLVTFKPGENDGTYISIENSYTSEAFAKVKAGLTGNHYLGNETFVSYDMAVSTGNKSNAMMYDLNGNQINFRDSSNVRNNEMFVRIQRKQLGVQYYSNDYNFRTPFGPYRIQMQNSVAELVYDHKFNSKQIAQIKGMHQFQLPWSYQNAQDEELNAYNTNVRRIGILAHLVSSWNRKVRSSIGTQLFTTVSKYELEHGEAAQLAGSATQRMNNAAIFADLAIKLGIGSFNLGARGEVNSWLPTQFVPRFSYGKVFRKAFVKFSYAQAYKIPTIQNMLLGPAEEDLKVERIKYEEFQIGFDITKKVTATANVFNSVIYNPIVYYADTISLDNYMNRLKSGTSGLEVSINVHSKRLVGNLGYCFFRNNSSKEDFPDIINSKGEILAFPSHRVCGYMRFKLRDNLAINSRIIAQKSVCIVQPNYESGSNQEVVLPFVALLNANLDFGFSKLQFFTLRVGVENILNTKYCAASPFNSGANPVQMNGREFRVELNYQITK